MDEINAWVCEMENVALPPALADQRMIDTIYDDPHFRNVQLLYDTTVEEDLIFMHAPRDMDSNEGYIIGDEEFYRHDPNPEYEFGDENNDYNFNKYFDLVGMFRLGDGKYLDEVAAMGCWPFWVLRDDVEVSDSA